MSGRVADALAPLDAGANTPVALMTYALPKLHVAALSRLIALAQVHRRSSAAPGHVSASSPTKAALQPCATCCARVPLFGRAAATSFQLQSPASPPASASLRTCFPASAPTAAPAFAACELNCAAVIKNEIVTLSAGTMQESTGEHTKMRYAT
jgi:hypothetical protein